jgi:hypothetical protein
VTYGGPSRAGLESGLGAVRRVPRVEARLGHAAIQLGGQSAVIGRIRTVLMSGYGEAVRYGARRVALNSGGLEYRNSGGIGMLVALLVRSNRGKKLAVFA